MKVTMNLQPMLDALDAAHRGACEDTLRDIQRSQKHLTGELAGSYHIVELATSRPHPGQFGPRKLFIVSSSVYADAVEHGANARVRGSVKNRTRARGIYEMVDGKRKRVGWEEGPLFNRAGRRGPHMKGNGLVGAHSEVWLEHMGHRLRGGNYSGRGRA